MTDKLRTFLAELSPDLLERFFAERSLPRYRVSQVIEWIYRKRIIDPDAMSNLPLELRALLKDSFICSSSHVLKRVESSDSTLKLLIGLMDSEKIESVIIPAKGRVTFCLSTQVGCPVGCRFCASGRDGFIRNLRAGEIIEQLFLTCGANGVRLPDNMVFMGTGEGMANFSNLARALEIISSPDYIGFAQRRITVSTSGWPSGIRKLACMGRQWNLALSLHAPDDKTRALLIPDRFRYPLKDILEACDFYREKTTRQFTFEYTLIRDINDNVSHAKELAVIARRHRAKVNLIPYNETGVSTYRRPNRAAVSKFQKILLDSGVNVTLRTERGSDVHAACGQLRSSGS